MIRFPKTLLLSWCIPPAPTGSGIIVGNLAQQFRSDEMVVLGAYSLGAPPVHWRSEWAVLRYATVNLKDGCRGERWIRGLQLPWLLLRAWRIMSTHRCEAILVVFPDQSYLLAGYMLALLTGKPLYAYFHNTYLEQKHGSALARWLQPRVLKLARHVFLMSEGMLRLYRTRYPAVSCSPLVHSFNESIPRPQDVVLPPVHLPLRLVLPGNVNASNAEAASRVAQLLHTTPDAHLTVLSATALNFLKNLGFAGSRITIKTVSRDNLLEHLRQADIVLLCHGFKGYIPKEEISSIFPTRTIEALISQRPILAHLPKDCFLADFLRRSDCAWIVDEPDLEALRQGVERLRQDGALRHHLVRQALRAARQFQATTVAAELRRVVQAETQHTHSINEVQRA